jgi:UDP-glucose:(heptosyl)LPS alpha-1,3-glucosyltransferase
MKCAIACRRVAGVTGTTTTILEHSRRLAALGWEVHVYGDELDEARLRESGAQPRPLWNLPWSGSLRRRFFAWRFERALAREMYDLVWGHGDTFTQDILSLHNCVHATHEAVKGEPLPEGKGIGPVHARQLRERRFSLLIANSQLMKDDVVRRFGVPPATVEVIHPGHDPRRFSPGRDGELRAKLEFSERDLVLGLVTSGDFEKRGVKIFLDAFRSARAARPELKALILGKGKGLDLSGLDGAAVVLPLASDVERHYRALDVYVHPAHYEEFGQSVQEAMASGLPVLSTKTVGACELMGPEGRALLLPRPEAGALAKTMLRLAEDSGLRERLGRDNAAAVRKNDWDENFRKSLVCIERVLAAKKRR